MTFRHIANAQILKSEYACGPVYIFSLQYSSILYLFVTSCHVSHTSGGERVSGFVLQSLLICNISVITHCLYKAFLSLDGNSQSSCSAFMSQPPSCLISVPPSLFGIVATRIPKERISHMLCRDDAKKICTVAWRANHNKSRSKGLLLCQVAGDHIQVAGWCGSPGDTWGGPRHVKTAVGTFEELGKCPNA